jgi:hypothetical protein
VTQGTPLTSGRFTSAEGADQSAPYSGPNAGPPFPGEDFLVNLPSAISSPVDLADGASTIVLSVEPDLDGVDPTGDAPFSIKPLVAPVPSGLADHTLTALDQNLGSVPTGTATLDASAQVAVPAAADTGNAGLAATSGSGGTAAFAFGALAVLLGGAYVARRGLGRGRA